MTQSNPPAPKKKNPRRNSSVQVQDWAKKRQEKIEAAKAKREAVQLGEVTEHHTFTPKIKAIPLRRPSRENLDIGDSARNSIDFENFPRVHSSQNSSQSTPKQSQRDVAQNSHGNDLHNALDARSSFVEHHAAAVEATKSLSSDAADMAEFSNVLHTREEAPRRSNRITEMNPHTMGFAPSVPDEQLRSSSTFIEDQLRNNRAYGAGGFYDPSETPLPSSSAVSWLPPSRDSNLAAPSVEAYEQSAQFPASYGDADAQTTAAIAAALAQRSHDQARHGMGRARQMPHERQSSGADAECMVATVESLRDAPTIRPPSGARPEDFSAHAGYHHDRTNNGASAPLLPPPPMANFSWQDVNVNVAEFPLGPRTLGGTSTASMISSNGPSLGRSSSRQEAGQQIYQLAQQYGTQDGRVSAQMLHGFLVGTPHEEFLHWLTNATTCVRFGAVDMDELTTALKIFYSKTMEPEVATPRQSERGMPSLNGSDGGSSWNTRSLQASHTNSAPALPIVCPTSPRTSESGRDLLSRSSCTDRAPIVLPWREAPLRREEVSSMEEAVPSAAVAAMPPAPQPFHHERNAPLSRTSSLVVCRDARLQEVARQALPVSNSRGADACANLETSNSLGEDDERRRARRNRALHAEQRCQQLQDQLGEARQAEVELRQELLNSLSKPSTNREAYFELREDFVNSLFDRGSGQCLLNASAAESGGQQEMFSELPTSGQSRPEVRQWLGTAPRTEVHTLLAPLPAPSSSITESFSSRAMTNSCSQRLQLSPVAEETQNETRFSNSSEDSPPQRESPPGSPERSRSTSQDTFYQLLGRSKGGEDTPDDDVAEMQKLMNMCTRLKNEDETLPRAELDSLNSLVEQLSNLMERRRQRRSSGSNLRAPSLGTLSSAETRTPITEMFPPEEKPPSCLRF